MGSMIGRIIHRRTDDGTLCEGLFINTDDPSNPLVLPLAFTMMIDTRGNNEFVGTPYVDVIKDDIVVSPDGFNQAAGIPGTWHDLNECPDR